MAEDWQSLPEHRRWLSCARWIQVSGAEIRSPGKVTNRAGLSGALLKAQQWGAGGSWTSKEGYPSQWAPLCAMRGPEQGSKSPEVGSHGPSLPGPKCGPDLRSLKERWRQEINEWIG